MTKDARRGVAGDLLDPTEEPLRPHLGVVDAQPHGRVAVEGPRLGLGDSLRELALQIAAELLVEAERQLCRVTADRVEVGSEGA